MPLIAARAADGLAVGGGGLPPPDRPGRDERKIEDKRERQIAEDAVLGL